MKKKNLVISSGCKGQIVGDLAFALIFLVGLAIVVIVVNSIVGGLNDEVQADVTFSNQSKAVMQNVNDNYPGTWDAAFFFASIMLWIAMIVSTLFIDTHPIFFIINLILVILFLVGVMAFANVYEDFADDPDMSVFADNYPKLNWINDNLLWIFIIYSGTAMISLYAKSTV